MRVCAPTQERITGINQPVQPPQYNSDPGNFFIHQDVIPPINDKKPRIQINKRISLDPLSQVQQPLILFLILLLLIILSVFKLNLVLFPFAQEDILPPQSIYKGG